MKRKNRYPVFVATRLSHKHVQQFDQMLDRIQKTKSEFLREKVLEAINPQSKAE